MTRTLRQFMPAIVVALIGLILAILLSVLAFQVLTADKPVERVIATEDGFSNTATKVSPVTDPSPVQVTQTVAKIEQPAQSKPATPKSQPEPAPAPAAAVVIASDGCTVTATGAPGAKLIAGSTNGRKGGEVTYTLPATGKLTISVGGIQGFTSYAKLFDLSGGEVASTTSTIALAQCVASAAQ